MMMQTPRPSIRPWPSIVALHAQGTWILFLVAVLIAAPNYAQPATAGDELSPGAQRLLDDELLTDVQRRELMIFHGQWEALGELSPMEALQIAVLQHDAPPPIHLDEGDEAALENVFLLALLQEENMARVLRLGVTGGYRSGYAQETLNLVEDFDLDTSAPPSALTVARLFEDLGQYDQALAQLTPLRERALSDRASITTAADLTAAAEAILMLARLEGRPSADFHRANELLSQAHEEADPLYWPAYVVEARMLFEHGNPSQAIEAVSEALALNPKSSEAWYLLGTMMTRFFNFDAANRAAEKLYAINPHHPLGAALSVQIALRQKDVAAAREVIDDALMRYPNHRLLLALDAATCAMAYDDDATQETLAAFDALAPGNPLAQFHVGRALADARQYEFAEPYLQETIRRQPGWSSPQLELGQLYMQWGYLERAAAQLQLAAVLDPFHKDITNTLRLAQEMLGYATIETDHFIIRYRPGIDEVLARDMARRMQPMAALFSERFGQAPTVKTQVDLMPDDEHFAVRVTGIPDIWTIAACTGDVIAMTPPRPGPKRAFGTFNWLNVMRHEYTHTVNLSQTHNRVPHWFTEGCAVNMETTGRRWSQYQLLAECYNNDKLFAFDDLNWGFIRPTEDYHRALAYAQSAWMMQYIEAEYGWDKAITLLTHFSQGASDRDALEQSLEVSVEDFMVSFHAWAGEDVGRWRMAAVLSEEDAQELAELLTWLPLRENEEPERFARLAKFADHPDVLRLQAQMALQGDDSERALAALENYRNARPADPWTHRQLTRLAIQQGRSEDAIESMTYLDKIEGDAPEYAVELARVHRRAGRLEEALFFAERAVLREPYSATYRELVATIAVQSGDIELGAFHIEALALIEPSRSIHPRRLAAVYRRLNRAEDAAAAAARAEELKALE